MEVTDWRIQISSRLRAPGNDHFKFAVTVDEGGRNSGQIEHFYFWKAIQNFFPQNFELKLGKPVADTSMDSKTK